MFAKGMKAFQKKMALDILNGRKKTDKYLDGLDIKVADNTLIRRVRNKRIAVGR